MAARRLIGAVNRQFRWFPHSISPSHIYQNNQLRSLGVAFLAECSLEDSFAAVERLRASDPLGLGGFRCYSSRRTNVFGGKNDGEELEEEEEDDDDDEEESDEGEVGESCGEEEICQGTSKRVVQSGKSEAEKVEEAAAIGYKVIGSLSSSENPFKPYELVFAVVQIGSHQFKVSNGDSIFTERLKFCQVNDKLVLNKVLMLGSRTQTIIGRPILPDAAVHAVVEEHALDAKVIIFKKKRRKNYRRTKGHRQELTKLRVTNIEGIDKSESVALAA
ncbi:50S ribosomal protein L21, mitochondrial [Apostasia shenzhenica]|uniref:Large ribosomal subunit protein bL21m n=1 Tax=Apostasia shenzhenica TaxID=1088818 RepID=A0A2I0BEE8_9ASPA|nr:50S ribosomal protein L21, mitochondrial [Apostasia shenzhenica]